MSTKFLSPGWRMPRNANQSKQANYSLDLSSSKFIDCGTDLWDQLKTGNAISVSWWHKSDGGSDVFPFNFRPAFSGSSLQMKFAMHWSGGGTPNNWFLRGTGIGNQVVGVQPKLPASGWNHYTLSLELGSDTSKQVFYLNGQQIGTTTTAVTSVDQGTNYLYLSQYYSSTYTGTSGTYSSIAFFDYALSQSQVTTLHGDSTNGPGNPMALPSSPVAYYPLGTSAWNGQYLAENNAIGDYVFDFNPNGNIDTNFTLPNYSDYSYSFWIKNTGSTSGSDQWILGNSSASVSGDTGYRGAVRINNSTKIRIFGGDDTNYYRKQYDFTAGNAQGNTNIFNGGWYNIVITFTSGTIVFYVNGVAQTQEWNTNTPITGFAANNSYRIGQSGVNTGYLNNSLLSNVQIFNTVLLQSDAETLYNYGSPIQTLANIPQNSNLKAWYKLDASEIYNSSSTEWEVNNALSPWTSSLNLIPNDYIDCGNDSSLSISGDLTLSAWVYLDTTPNSYMSIFSKMSSTSRNYTLYARNNRKFSITTQASGGVVEFTTSNTAIPLKTWTHIVVTFDSGVNNGTKYYFNGIPDAVTGTHNVVADTSNLNIGKRDNGTTSTQYLDGKISNAQIFNTALPATGSNSVETLYNSGTPLTDMSSFSSLVSWWKLDNTTTGIEDSKGSNNGTNNGATEAPGSVSTLNGESSGMSQSNLIQSDLQTVAPYSKYAMNFGGDGSYIDLNSDITLTGNKSVSFWVNFTSTIFAVVFGGDSSNYYPFIDSTNINIRAVGTTSSFAHGGLTAGIWYNVCIAGDGTNATAYLNGSSLGTQTDRGFTFKLINAEGAGFYGVNGKLSNCAIWNTALTASEAKEIYNEGRPSNLHNFSGTAPVAWWQLGENSSFNGNDWIVADEIGSNNGESNGMPVGALTNGVGTTANGTSTGMSESSLIGDAPYSTANAISSGMPVTARGTDVPPTP